MQMINCFFISIFTFYINLSIAKPTKTDESNNKEYLVKLSEFPSFYGITDFQNHFTCGGVLLDSNNVLTTGSCAKVLEIVAKQYAKILQSNIKGQSSFISKKIYSFLHFKFNILKQKSIKNIYFLKKYSVRNLGLLKLCNPISKIKYAKLPKEKLSQNSQCFIVGFDKNIENDKYYLIKEKVLSVTTCKNKTSTKNLICVITKGNNNFIRTALYCNSTNNEIDVIYGMGRHNSFTSSFDDTNDQNSTHKFIDVFLNMKWIKRHLINNNNNNKNKNKNSSATIK